MDFLPITIEDMQKRGWDRPDFVYHIVKKGIGL